MSLKTIAISSTTLFAALLIIPFLLFATSPSPSPQQTITFTASDEDMLNPERGTFSSIYLDQETTLEWYAKQGYRLVIANVDIRQFKNKPISDEFLNKMRGGFRALRKAGVKVILRSSYNNRIGDSDASLERILGHIEQLRPLYQEYADVITVVQAGFIGAWGEWHNSSHKLTDSSPKKKIMKALLKAVPKNRFVQFRYPKDFIEWYPKPLTAAQAFTGTQQSRIGMHNDCFIADVNDAGTYTTGKIEEEKNYHAAIAPYIAMGGESCIVNAKTEQSYRSCANALKSMKRFHFSYMSGPGDETTHKILTKEGCWNEIKKKLGYRLKMLSATLPTSVKAGEKFSATLQLTNEGYAALYNERPVYLVLDGAIRQQIKINTDPRRWQPSKPITLVIQQTLPNDLPAGQYKAALWMPDASQGLQSNSDFSIRTANKNIWDKDKGYNLIGVIAVKAKTP